MNQLIRFKQMQVVVLLKERQREMAFFVKCFQSLYWKETTNLADFSFAFQSL